MLLSALSTPTLPSLLTGFKKHSPKYHFRYLQLKKKKNSSKLFKTIPRMKVIKSHGLKYKSNLKTYLKELFAFPEEIERKQKKKKNFIL
jgi:hypothetical protein